MYNVRSICTVAVIVSLSVSAAMAGEGKKGKQKGRSAHGVVVEVKKDADKDNGSVIVRVHHKGKGGSPDRDELRTFQILPTTKFVVAEGKGQQEASTFKELHEGQHVIVQTMDDRPNTAQHVAIRKAKK